MRDQHNKTKLSNKPMAWRIKPKETDIDFNTPEQKRLVTKRLNPSTEGWYTSGLVKRTTIFNIRVSL